MPADAHDIADETFDGRRFTGEVFERASVLDCTFTDCDLSAVEFREATIERTTFTRCRMSAVNLSAARLRDVRFVECKLDDVNFRMATGKGVLCEDSVMTGADFYAAELAELTLLRCDLAGAEFSKCKLEGADLRGSRLDGLNGAVDLAAVKIDSAQMIPVALSIFAARKIVIDDDGVG